MYRNRLFVALLGVVCFALSAQAAKEPNSEVAGLWLYKGDGTRIDLDLKADGKCVFDVTNGQKKSTITGTYHVEPNRLVVTNSKKKTIKYAMKLNGNQMILSGGDFGEGNELAFSKREVAQADHPAAADAPKEMARNRNKDKDADKPANDAGADVAGLPGGKWDLKAFKDHFTIVKDPRFDSVKNTVTFLIERKDEGYINWIAEFYDADDVKLGTMYLAFDPGISSVKNGERLRGVVSLLSDDKMKQCVRVVLVKS